MGGGGAPPVVGQASIQFLLVLRPRYSIRGRRGARHRPVHSAHSDGVGWGPGAPGRPSTLRVAWPSLKQRRLCMVSVLRSGGWVWLGSVCVSGGGGGRVATQCKAGGPAAASGVLGQGGGSHRREAAALEGKGGGQVRVVRSLVCAAAATAAARRQLRLLRNPRCRLWLYLGADRITMMPGEYMWMVFA